jgi:hypothetical protein
MESASEILGIGIIAAVIGGLLPYSISRKKDIEKQKPIDVWDILSE